MMMFKKYKLAGSVFLIAAFLGVTISPVQAAVPKLLAYQGVLKNSSGSYLTGTYSIVFRIYSASTGGSALWTETQSSVAASSGKFSVLLGSVTAITLDFNSDYWLSIQVGADAEMSPRVRLTSVGYGIRSDYESNGFTQAQHDALSHENIAGVKDNSVIIAKTNFKLDAYTLAAANSMGDMVVDTFNDASGINTGSSSNYAWRGTPDYDVTVLPSGGSAVKQSTDSSSGKSMLCTPATDSYNGQAQLFRPTSGVVVDKATFKWSRDGSPSGNVRIRLYTSSSGLPGTLLAETSNIAVSSAPVYPNYAELTASFTAQTLTANTDYIIALENIDGSGDTTNYLSIVKSSSDVFTPGNLIYKSNSSVWTTQSGFDAYFKVYEQLTYSGSGTVVSNAYAEPAAPAEAMVIVDETLGTGSITYSVSRDNGTTWTTCSKETVTSISAQPSGTQLKWKAVITGNAQLNAIAVAV